MGQGLITVGWLIWKAEHDGDHLVKSNSMCGAHARTTGAPCKAMALPNGRCKLHGGMSTGPKTFEGRKAIAAATKARMSNGQLEKAIEGRRRWLEAGGGAMIKHKATERIVLTGTRKGTT